ncbi:MAG TPA: metal ABC transporter permease [Chloroflexota bacterium]|nr:metal ABC transporter permease [Chloroflexota bacterium]
MGLISALTGPLEFELTRRALLEVTLVGLACGAVGLFVVLRGLSFIGDALAHCVVPGVVVGYLTRTSFELWGLFAAMVSAWGIGLLVRSRWLGTDASVAVVFTAMFALGLTMISATGSYFGDLTEILFGNILAVDANDIVISSGAAVIVLMVIVLLYRPLVLASFDPTSATALGLPLRVLDFILYGLLALAIVCGIAAVGSFLVTALLIVPAAAARLVTRGVKSQMLVSCGLGVLAGWLGLYASYYYPIASGGAVVLAAVALFGVTLLLSPRSGLSAVLAERHLRRELHAARPTV